MGGRGEFPQAQEILAHARFPVLTTVEAAARTFDHMWRYSHNLRAIYETPELHADVTERASIRRVEDLIMNARRAGRDLIEHEWKEVLAAYGFPALDGPAQAGVNWYELQIGSRNDPEFGPVLWFGLGGRSAELCAHQVVGLPPLNATLARRMVERSPFFAGLKAQADRGQLSLTTLDAALVRLSQLVIEHPGIKAVQIAPLAVSTWGAFARNARIELHGPELDEDHLPKSAFRPFPARYVSEWATKGGDTVTLRPIRAEDEPLIAAFHAQLSDETVYQRYFQVVKLDRRTAHEALIHACFVDYDREMVLVAERRDPSNGARSIVAVANLSKLPRKKKAEISVLVSDAYQRQGLGFELVRRLVDVARDERLEQVEATTLTDNRGMCAVFERLGFTLSCDDADGSVVAVLALANH
jgi:acetyltransferase